MSEDGYRRADDSGVPVVSTPEEIDITTAEELRAILLDATSGQDPVIVVDMSQTLFCDSAGLNTVLRAHKRVTGEGRELRVVIGADGSVSRVLSLTGVDRILHCFTSLAQALAPDAPVDGPSGPDQDQDQAAS